MRLNRLWTIALCAVGVPCAATMGDQTLSGSLAAGSYRFFDENITLNGLVLQGDTEIEVENGKIIVSGAGVWCNSYTVVNGSAGASLSCGSNAQATSGQDGRNGYVLALRTSGESSGTAATDIDILAPVDLSGRNGGYGGRGLNGAYYSPPFTCCQVAPGDGGHGGLGGRGGELLVYSGNDVRLASTIDLGGGDGGAAGDGGKPYGGQPAVAAGFPGAGGHGGEGGRMVVESSANIYINDDVALSLVGGAGGSGGDGASGTTCTIGTDGGDGGAGGTVVFSGSFLGSESGSTGTLTINSYGGDGAAGGAGGGGEISNAFTACGSAVPSKCIPAAYLRGESMPGGLGGRGGSGGSTQLLINGDITLPNQSTTIGLYIASYGAWSGSISGLTPESGAVMNSGCCAVGRVGITGAVGQQGGHGGAIVIRGDVLTLDNCYLTVAGGGGGSASDGGDVSYYSCGTHAAGGNGGEGGAGGDGGTIHLISTGGMNCTGGTYMICTGSGGAGGDGGAGSCPGGLGGAGGAQGMVGTFLSSGTGTLPSLVSCPWVADGSDGIDYCP